MKKILVVNNDIDTMTLLKSWLEKKAYKVKYTSSGEEVPQIIKEFNPNLVMLDVLHNDVVKVLKDNLGSKKIPILLMTGYTVQQKTSHLPVNDVIEKPFNLNLLEKKIEKLVKSQ